LKPRGREITKGAEFQGGGKIGKVRRAEVKVPKAMVVSHRQFSREKNLLIGGTMWKQVTTVPATSVEGARKKKLTHKSRIRVQEEKEKTT